MRYKVLIFFFFVLNFYFVSAQVEIQKSRYKAIRDSCNIQLNKQFSNHDFIAAKQTLDYAKSIYNKLDENLKKELSLEESFKNAYASIFYYASVYYSSISDEENTVKYLKKAVKAGFKDYSWWQNPVHLPEEENEEINNELIELGKLKITNNPDTVFLPWHLTDIWAFSDQDIPFKKLEIDFSILTDIPDSLNLYIAPINGTINQQLFYGGLQSNKLGKKNLIFSRWNERDKRAIRKQETGTAVSSGDEGDFISVRNPYKWSKGHYKITLSAENDTIMLNDKTHRWVTMKIFSEDSQEEVINGSLAFPGNSLTLKKDLAIFVEIFGSTNEKYALKDLPQMKFSFDKFIVNGTDLTIYSIATYPIEYPKLIDVNYQHNKISLDIGRHTERESLKMRKGFYFEPLFNQNSTTIEK